MATACQAGKLACSQQDNSLPKSIAGLVLHGVTPRARLMHSELPRDQAQAQGIIVLARLTECSRPLTAPHVAARLSRIGQAQEADLL